MQNIIWGVLISAFIIDIFRRLAFNENINKLNETYITEIDNKNSGNCNNKII